MSVMEFHCQNCGHPIVLDGPPAAHEVKCPSCGAMTKWSAPPAPAPGGNRPHSRRRMLRKAIDPIPRPFAYLIGAVAVLLLLSPFWILWLKDVFEHQRPLVTDD